MRHILMFLGLAALILGGCEKKSEDADGGAAKTLKDAGDGAAKTLKDAGDGAAKTLKDAGDGAAKTDATFKCASCGKNKTGPVGDPPS